MRIFIDTEFIEDGKTIDLVSIALVADDGREQYMVSSDFDQSALHRNPWLVEHVWPSLPIKTHAEGIRCRCIHGHLDTDHPDVRPRAQIARVVEDFIRETPSPSLWADHSAYDHVVLAQLWGPMTNLPAHVPMRTNDLQQEAERLGLTDDALPKQQAGYHNSLQDARHNQVIARFLDNFAAAR